MPRNSSSLGLGGRRRLGTALAAAALAVLTAATPVYALTFGSPLVLSGGKISNGWPGSLASSGGSYVHIVYRVLDPDGRIVRYRRSANGGASWSAPIELSRPAATESARASLSVVGATVDVVWGEGNLLAGPSAVWYRRSTNSGATWTAPVRISPTSHAKVGTPTVARQGNTVLVTYTDENGGGIYFRRSINGGTSWEAVRWLGATTNQPAGVAYEGWPSMAFGSGILYAVWASAEKNVVLKRSVNGGLNWTAATTLGTTHFGDPPRITASGSEAMVGFGHFLGPTQPIHSQAAFRKTTNKGASWGPRVRISGGTLPASAQDVRYTGGRYRLVYGQWLDAAGEKTALFYRESVTGATWTSPVRFTHATNAGATALGIGHTSLTGKTWLGWAGFAPNSDADIFVRSVQ